MKEKKREREREGEGERGRERETIHNTFWHHSTSSEVQFRSPDITNINKFTSEITVQ